MPAAPTVNLGIRSTNVGINQDRRVVDMRDRIYDYDPNATPMLTILSRRAPAMRAINPVFKHLEDQPLPWWDVVNGAQTATETAIEVDNGAYFNVRDLVLNPRTVEVFKVTAVVANTLTTVRAFTGDGINGVAMNDNDTLAIIGNTNEENAGAPLIKTTLEVTVENYCQTIRNSLGASEVLSGSDQYGGSEQARQRLKAGTHHNFLVERAFLFGKKKEATGAGGHRERSTGGLISQWIATIIDNASGTLTAATLESFCEKLFRYGSKSKLALASRRASSQLDLIAEGRLQVVPEADTYGVKVRRFVSAHGELLFATHDMFINDYAGYIVGVDMENVGKRFMNDKQGRARDNQLRVNIQANDVDGWQDEYLSDVGLHVYLENAHGVLKGIT